MTWEHRPICDSCWWKDNPGREPHRMRESYRQPERCYRCGAETRSGIYVRAEA